MLYISEADVRELLPMRDCIELMQAAFERLGSGVAVNHPRRRLALPTRSVLHYMAGSDGKYFGAKVYSSNPASGAHFFFLLYRAEDAVPLAMVEANHLGQIRTGAASGYATRRLARPDSRTVAIIGSGFQARTQLEAMLAVLPVEQVRVWSRSEAKRESFAQEASTAFRVAVQATATVEDCVRGADVVVTATYSGEPVVASEWVGPGVHINAIGSNQPRRREIPADLVLRCNPIVVDSREQARMESGDLLLALEPEDWVRVYNLSDAENARRTSPEAISLFKSNGLAVEDVIAAGVVYERLLAIPERASAAQFRARH